LTAIFETPLRQLFQLCKYSSYLFEWGILNTPKLFTKLTIK